MSKKQKNRILFIIAILTFFIGCIPLTVPSLKSENSGLITISIWCLSAVILSFWALEAHEDEYAKKQRGIKKGNVPLFESNCTHISGLASFTAEGKIRIYVDRIHFTVAGTHYELPMDRIINMGISTTSHTEYDLKAHPMRGVIGGLLLGEFGLLWGAEHELVKTETKEYFLVIAYSKDEATKFITLGNVDCKKIISTVSKYVDFQEQNVQL